MKVLELKMTKEASLLHFETRFAYETAYFTDIIAISQMPTTYFFDCHPPPPSYNHQNINNYFDPSVGLIKVN